MSNIQLKDNENNNLFPVTKSENVQFTDGSTLDEKLANIKPNTTWDDIKNKPNTFYSETEPALAKENDIWYKLTNGTATKTFSYKNSVQEFIVPETSEYTITCYGARGGYRNNSSTTYAGKGGKVSGKVNLTEGETLYIYTGQNGNITLNEGEYTFNGGGRGAASYQCGGGATDIRLVGGSWDDETSLLSRIIVAGGGGSCGGTSKQGGNSDTSATSGYGTGGNAGTQSAGGTGSSTYTETKGLFGKGGHGIYRGSGYGGAGGGGWYGGAGTYPDSSGDDDKGGGGGSNYILTESSTKPDGYTPSSKYYFTETSTTTTNDEIDGKVEIIIPTKVISETYVYHNNEWNPISKEVDTNKIMNGDTFNTLSTTNKTIVGSINEVFQSVSSGKSSIAQAITSKGVTASATDSFSSLSTKIKNIKVKKYDTGETLTENTNFTILPKGITTKEDSSYTTNNNIVGTVVASSDKYLCTYSYESSTYYYCLYELDESNKYKQIAKKSNSNLKNSNFQDRNISGKYCVQKAEYQDPLVYNIATGENFSITNAGGMGYPNTCGILNYGDDLYYLYYEATPPTLDPDLGPLPGDFNMAIGKVVNKQWSQIGSIALNMMSVSTEYPFNAAISDKYIAFGAYDSNNEEVYYYVLNRSDASLKYKKIYSEYTSTAPLGPEKIHILNDLLIIITCKNICLIDLSTGSTKKTIANDGGFFFTDYIYDDKYLYMLHQGMSNGELIRINRSTYSHETFNTVPTFKTTPVENYSRFIGATIVELDEPLKILLK